MFYADSVEGFYEQFREAVSPLESVIEAEKNRDRAEMLEAVKVLRRMFPDGVSLLELAQAAVDRIAELEKQLETQARLRMCLGEAMHARSVEELDAVRKRYGME